MKKIIIVSPHFPPSNLAAVHRSRLFAQHLPDFGWEPIIVTVDHQHYEEELDWNLHDLLPSELRVEKVGALPTKPVRVIGEIGIRGFWNMYRRILQIAKKEKINFLYIPIPSHYAALLGRCVYAKTGIPYGIDYIDPWVHVWPGTERRFSKHWWSMKMSEVLEPIAVKKAALITGVAPGYYEDVLERNPAIAPTIQTAAMPYGGEATDHHFVKEKDLRPYLFSKKEGVWDMIYAGAMLPKAYEPLKQLLAAIAANKEKFRNVRFHFIGTGKSPNDPQGFNIKPWAQQYGLWESVIFEYPKRIPYLDVLAHLNATDGAFILGSTEAHYTPSKVYQSVLSGKPIFAILHSASTACSVIEKTHAGVTLSFDGEGDVGRISAQFMNYWEQYLPFAKNFDPAQIVMEEFDRFSARNVTRILAEAIEKVI